MLYSYFKIKDKHYKTLNCIKNNLNPQQDTLAIKKKINKLNEYQFFFLLNDLLHEYPMEHLSLHTLELFFEKGEINIKQNYHLPFQDSSIENDFAPATAKWVYFKYKNDVDYITDYFLNTKEYPKETLITKLLVLSDKILELIFHPLIQIKSYFVLYVENDKNIENDENLYFLRNIIMALESRVNQILELSFKIQEKINTLSKISIQNENYLIDTNDETLKKLYFGLEQNMLIDQDKTSLKQFLEVLKQDWNAHNSIIHLEMGNIQFKYFIDCMHQFLHLKIPITFIQRSGNIRNKNGIIKAGSMYTTSSNNSIKQKDLELIKSVFEELQ